MLYRIDNAECGKRHRMMSINTAATSGGIEKENNRGKECVPVTHRFSDVLHTLRAQGCVTPIGSANGTSMYRSSRKTVFDGYMCQ